MTTKESAAAKIKNIPTGIINRLAAKEWRLLQDRKALTQGSSGHVWNGISTRETNIENVLIGLGLSTQRDAMGDRELDVAREIILRIGASRYQK